MLSYQHAYHAGNAADLHKHSALAAVIALLTAKARPITVLESHAGRGLYRLDSAEALKTGDAAGGIGRAEPGPGPFADALAATRAAHGAAAYPGSPLIAAALLRPQDRLVLCELHPGEHAALTDIAGARAEIHRRDGHEGLRALCPPEPRRGLALIDPSYEVKAEYEAAADTALSLHAQWPEGVVMLWYPILPAGRHEALIERLRAAPDRLVGEVAFHDPPARGMTGSGIALLNPPYGAADALAAAWDGFAEVFGPAP